MTKLYEIYGPLDLRITIEMDERPMVGDRFMFEGILYRVTRLVFMVSDSYTSIQRVTSCNIFVEVSD